MFLLDDKVCCSASDLAAAATCEFALLRRLDARLGRVEATPAEPDPMLERTARLGAAHERRVLDEYVQDVRHRRRRHAGTGPHRDRAGRRGIRDTARRPR